MCWTHLRNGIFLKNTALVHVSTAVILTMASQSALNPLINLGSTKPNPSSSGLKAAMVAMVAVVAVVAVVAMVAVMAGMTVEIVMVQDVGVVMVLTPTHAGSGKAMLRLSMQSPLLVALENIRASGAWCVNLAGGIPLAPPGFRTPMSRILLCFLYLPPISSGLSPVRAPLRRDAVLLLPLWPFHLLRQPPACSALEWVHWLHSFRQGPMIASFCLPWLTSR